MKHTNATLILDAKATLGEGAIWHPTEQKLYWVDIEGQKLHVFDPMQEHNKTFDVHALIGTVVPAAQGGVLVALQNGIHHVATETGKLTFMTNPIKEKDIRFNDGKCDPQGRFWVGTMALDQRKGAAALYKMNTDGSTQQMLTNLTISNGIAWSGDSNVMYLTDTPTQQIKAFDFDPDSGTISGERVVVQVPEKDGSPDGFTLDADGNIWVALHGGGAVVCYDPATGEALHKIEVACPQTTSCAFGGKNLDTLYITTATQGLDQDKLKEYPNSGGVFMASPGVKGVEANFYEGDVYTFKYI